MKINARERAHALKQDFEEWLELDMPMLDDSHPCYELLWQCWLAAIEHGIAKTLMTIGDLHDEGRLDR